ncbi:MAG: coproporphyrinogen III oxidase family protein, partial [Desulfoferrobacter sp.]
WWNLKSVELYCQALAGGQAPMAGSESLSQEQLKLESLYLGLRTKDGVSTEILTDSPQMNDRLAQLQAGGLVNLNDGRIVPTGKGFLVADSLPLMLLD